MVSNELPYIQHIDEKISSLMLENKNILSHSELYNEDKVRYEITLSYRSFSVILYYSNINIYGYSFLENDNTAKQLVTKFVFPFSDIPYSIYDVHNAVEDTHFDTYNFHCLYNYTQVLEAMDAVVAFISRNLNIIELIGENDTLRSKLDDSFDKGLSIASKKITREKIIENPEKYIEKHDVDLYFYRLGETAFTDHINKGSKGELQRFFAKQSKKGRLLPYEERYLEFLYANDFNIPNQTVHDRVKSQEETSKGLDVVNRVAIFLSLLLGIGLDILLGVMVERKLEREYYLLNDLELTKMIPLFFFVISIYAVIHTAVEFAFRRRNKDFDSSKTKSEKKGNAVLALVGVVVIVLTATFTYYDYHKVVGLGEKDIYYCQHLGKEERLSYDDVRLYLIEGRYYDDNVYSDTYYDKQIVLVKDDNYKNYYLSDYFDYIDIPKSFFEDIVFEDTFKDFDEFCQQFNV